MQQILWIVVSWLIREVIVKFIVMAGVMAVIVELLPIALGLTDSFTSTGYLSSLFSGLPAGVWWFLDVFRLDVGVPLVISAQVARFLIRRIPFVG